VTQSRFVFKQPRVSPLTDAPKRLVPSQQPTTVWTGLTNARLLVHAQDHQEPTPCENNPSLVASRPALLHAPPLSIARWFRHTRAASLARKPEKRNIVILRRERELLQKNLSLDVAPARAAS